MAKDELIDEHVSQTQVKRAVTALLTHETKAEQARNENELIPGKEPNVWLVVTVKKMQATHKIKPIRIPIAHPIVDPRTTPVCLITKDPQREYKDLLEEKGIKFISRVVGIAKLKGKFKPFEARRMLLKENGLFLADDRIIPLLPKLLGSKWFEAKKQPIPVSLSRKDLKSELERAISSTYMHQNQGTCTSIKVGTLSQKSTQVLSNITTAIPAIVAAIKDGWENIQSLHIKTNSSVSLPIWTCDLGDASGGRWDGLVADEDSVSDEEAASENEASDDDDEKTEKEEPSGKKGKKRSAAEMVDTPKKKSKKSDGQAIPTTKPTKPTVSPDVPKPSKKSPKETTSASALSTKTKKVTKPTPPASSPTKGTTKPSKSSTDKPPKSASTPLSPNTNASIKPTKASAKPAKTKTSPPTPSKPLSNPPPPSAAPITTSDLKKKRDGAAITKKKEKTVSMKDSKSIKASLLRKQAARS